MAIVWQTRQSQIIFLITCDINLRKPVAIFKRKIISRNLKAIDKDKFRYDISCGLQTAEIEVDTLNTILRETLNRHAPWFNSDVKAAKQERPVEERKWVKTGLQVHRGILMSALKKYNTTVCLAKRQYYWNKFTSAESCKGLFRATDELLRKNATPPFPTASTDQLPSYFLDFFTSMIMKIKENFDVSNENVQHPLSVGLYLSNFQALSEDEVKSVLENCPLKTCELDPVASTLLKDILDLVLPSITAIINSSLQPSIVPDSFKKAVVRPQLKKTWVGQKQLKKYRPVSNLPLLSKVLERLVLK